MTPKKHCASAQKAFATWSSRDYEDRVRLIRKAAELVEARLFELSALITYEVGKNRFEAIAEVSETVDMFRYYADEMEAHGGFVRPMKSTVVAEKYLSVMKPHGVLFAITPFNFPLALAGGICSAALLTGNTIVFKPAEEGSLSGLRLYQLLRDGGVPPGAINLITGPGENFEDAIVGDLRVAGIGFTGSREAGLKLYQEFIARQPYPKPFIAEMGSKNPTIVTAKADLDKAAEGVVKAAFGYCGQKCSATSRVYVESHVKVEFLNKLVEKTASLKVGDPRSKDVFMGPVIRQQAFEKYQEAINGREYREESS